MSKLPAFIVLATVFSTCAFAETFTGVITDARDGEKHAPYAAADIQAMKKCFSQGAVPILITVEGKIISIAYTSVDKVIAHAGEKVTVTGRLEASKRESILLVDTIQKVK